jgi:ABC-2 type transport system ATP-binding protein
MISFEHVSKRYGPLTAVDDVTFQCRPGTVTGFLGPNGAGKSTTLRILTGLALATSGRTSVAGVEYRRLDNPGRHVGVLLDASAQHAGRSGREALMLAAQVLRVPAGRVNDLLDLVDLGGGAPDRRVGGYSLGMRQRLGLAQALLGDPQVLVLDEPANGLDPEGIHWMRGLLRSFADGGGTVLLSSHLLREVEAVADHLVVIGKGRVLADGSAGDLLAGAGILVRAAEPALLASALARAGLAFTPAPGGGLVVPAPAIEVGRAATAAGVVLTELRVADGGGLEELFLSLTRSVAGDPAPAIAGSVR